MNSSENVSAVHPLEDPDKAAQSINVIGTDTNKQGNVKEDLLWDYGQNCQTSSRDRIFTYGIDDIFGKYCMINDCGK